MEPGEVRLYRRSTRYVTCALLLLPLACANRPHLDRAMMVERGTPVRNEGVAEAFRPGCPDVLEFTVAGRPHLTGRREIGPDGRIDLGPLGRVRVEGFTLEEVAARVADEAGLSPERVQVRVAEFRSQYVYVIGQVVGQQQAVAYRGPETVLDLLKRVGGVTAGAAPESVYVVRSRVAEGGKPEVFHIDLESVVSGRDPQTNVRLLPFDQVYVGENRRSSLEKCLPHWLRPAYVAMAGLRRAGPHRVADAQARDAPKQAWVSGQRTAAAFRGTAE